MAEEPLTLERARKLLAEHEREGDLVAVDHWRREILRLENPRAYADVQAKRRNALEREGRERDEEGDGGWIGSWLGGVIGRDRLW